MRSLPLSISIEWHTRISDDSPNWSSTPSSLADTTLRCICLNITPSRGNRGPYELVHFCFLSLLPRIREPRSRSESTGAEENGIVRTDSVNFAEQRKDGICEAAVSCRRYAISRTPSSRKRVRGWEVLGIASGPLSRELHPLTPPTTGTRRARRNGEKVAALSKRRCSRVEDSRGTTLRERHSGVEHAAAPYSPWNCACVRLWSLVWVAVRVYVWSAPVRARVPPISLGCISEFPHPRGSRHPFTLSPISRASLFPFSSSSSSTSTSCSSSAPPLLVPSRQLLPHFYSYLILLFSSSSRRRRRKSQLRPDKDAKKRESGYNLWPR